MDPREQAVQVESPVQAVYQGRQELQVRRDQVEHPALKVLPVHPVGVVQQESQDPMDQVAHPVRVE